MSNTTRWLLAFLLIILGIIMAVFSLAFLGFFTWGCYGPSNATAYQILYAASAVGLIGGIVPAVMLARKMAGRTVVIVIALGIIFTLISNGIFIFYTLNVC
jgi:hypothetical protein